MSIEDLKCVAYKERTKPQLFCCIKSVLFTGASMVSPTENNFLLSVEIKTHSTGCSLKSREEKQRLLQSEKRPVFPHVCIFQVFDPEFGSASDNCFGAKTLHNPLPLWCHLDNRHSGVLGLSLPDFLCVPAASLASHTLLRPSLFFRKLAFCVMWWLCLVKYLMCESNFLRKKHLPLTFPILILYLHLCECISCGKVSYLSFVVNSS